MRKKFISLAVALLLIIAMVVALVWQRNRDEVSEDEPDTPPARTERLIEHLEEYSTRIEFIHGDETIVMVPTLAPFAENAWTVEGLDYVFAPIETRSKVLPIFNLTPSQIVHEDITEVEELNLADFGLNPPDTIITVTFADRSTATLLLGDPTPDLRGFFLMKEGDPALYTVTTLNGNRLRMGIEDMLDTSLPPWEVMAVEYFFLDERGRDTIEVSLQEHEEHPDLPWLVMDQPLSGREVYGTQLGTFYMEDFIAGFSVYGLVNLHATDFSPYGLSDPSLVIIMQSQLGDMHLEFGDRFVRDIDGNDIEFIYVRFGDRPHVFEMLFSQAQPIFGMNSLRFIDRFIALVDIQSVSQVEVVTPTASYDIHINHIPDTHNDIEPTINGALVDVRGFRDTYIQLIGMSIDGDLEGFIPTTEPEFIIRYIRIEEDELELRFYRYDDHFYAVFVEDDGAWRATSRRGLNNFLSMLEGLIE